MRKKKTYIIILIILALYFLVLYFTMGKENVEKEKYSTTIIVGDYTIWSLTGKNWMNLSSETSINKLNWNKYNVYMDNKKIGNYYLWKDDKWYIFDENKKAINQSGKMLAYISNHDIDILDYKEEQITDYSYVHQVLKENGISTSSLFTTNLQTKVDVDSDGTTETLYVISNAFALDYIPDTIFSIVFIEKNGMIEYLYKNIDQNRNFNGCKPYLNYILDVDKDQKYEIIISCGKYSAQKQLDMLYKQTENGFKIAISNE